MTKIFALLGILLILTGGVLVYSRFAAPNVALERSAGPNSVGVSVREAPGLLGKARDIAEQVNAPLSILFGLMSLFYTRRTYLAQRGRADGNS